MQVAHEAAPQIYTVADVDAYEAYHLAAARDSFWAFRQLMNPTMHKSWWQREVCHRLQKFYDQMLLKQRPKLVIQAPPQHGKSDTIVDFIAWVSGKHPSFKTIYGSFSGRLGKRANKKLQRMFVSSMYRKVFPEFRIAVTADGSSADKVTLSQELIEFAGTTGSFRNTTVLGSVTGETLDLGVIDDPIKGRAQANSETIRANVWEWFTDDFLTRFSDGAGLLIILTRWHIDDPVGRMTKPGEDGLVVFPDMDVLSYPAIALVDDSHRKAGEALMPEHKSLDFLLERKKALGSANFDALYQQNPITLGGMLIKGKWFIRVGMPPVLKYRKIFADTAMKTKEANDYSVFECWGVGEDGKMYLLDLLRGKWEAPDLKRTARAFWAKHKDPVAYPHARWGHLREMPIEDKASGTGLIQEIKRGETVDGVRYEPIPVKAIERVTDKLTRVMDVVSYIEAGMVCVIEGSPYISDFIAECEGFTNDDSHAFDDQIDPMCDAISDMLGPKPRGFFDVIRQ